MTVTASLTTPTGTSTAQDSAEVRDSATTDPVLTGVSSSPPLIVQGDNGIGTVTIDCEAEADTVVSLASSDQAKVGVPATVTIPQGRLSATFTITTDVNAFGDFDSTITATLNGVPQQHTVTVIDNTT